MTVYYFIDGEASTILVAMTIFSLLFGILLVDEEDSQATKNDKSHKDIKLSSRSYLGGIGIIEYWFK